MIVTDDRCFRFVESIIGREIIPPATCMGIETDGEIIAAVVFNVYDGVDVHITAAGSGWTRGFLRRAGRYVFGQLGCERATIISEQPEVIGLAIRLGGQAEGFLRNQFGAGRDGVLVGILKKDWVI